LQLKEKIGFIADDRSNEINKYIDEWKKKLEVSPLKEDVVVFIPVTSRYSIAGPVASILRGQFPDKVFISYTIKDNTAIIEMRTRNDTSLNFVTILTRISENVEFINFGGHPPAAGASLHKDGLDDFLKKIKEEVVQDYSRSSHH
jgi:single-stranded DNA-specific DHH superfamily exonuclease